MPFYLDFGQKSLKIPMQLLNFGTIMCSWRKFLVESAVEWSVSGDGKLLEQKGFEKKKMIQMHCIIFLLELSYY